MSYIKVEPGIGQGGAMVDIANQNLANNNFEIIRKITAILDDQMEASNLASMMQHQNKVIGSTLNSNAEAFYPNGSCVTGPTASVPMAQNTNFVPGTSHYQAHVMQASQAHTPANQQPTVAAIPSSQSCGTNNQDIIADLQKLSNMNNVNWAAIQQAVAASKTSQNTSLTPQHSQQQQQSEANNNTPRMTTSPDPSSFIPGAISSRTLEHLTESMTRPARAIKGGTVSGKTLPPQEPQTPVPANNVGTIGDSRPSSTSPPNINNNTGSHAQHQVAPIDLSTGHRSAMNALNNSLMGMTSTGHQRQGAMTSPVPSIHAQPSSTPSGASLTSGNASGATSLMNMSMSRSCTPESDTSGVSSGGTSDVSDVALMDLMYNLNLGAKLNAHTQTTPPNISAAASGSQAASAATSLVHQLAAAAQQQVASSQPQSAVCRPQVAAYPQQSAVNQHYAASSQQYANDSQQYSNTGQQYPVAAQHSTCSQQQYSNSNQIPSSAAYQTQSSHMQSTAPQFQPATYQGAQSMYMYPQQGQGYAPTTQQASYPQTSTVANSLMPYQQAIHVDSYNMTNQTTAPAALISPYVLQPTHIQTPVVSSQQPQATSITTAATYPAMTQYSNMDLLRILACDVNGTGAYQGQLTPQPIQTLTPVHQVAPAEFAMNMDLITEKSANKASVPTALSALLGQSASVPGITTYAATDNDQAAIEKAAKWYRNAASVYEATCTWSGQLPPKIYKNPVYSCKVFLGGVPWDITETGLQSAFKAFGPTRIEWPQEGKHRIRNPMKAGYVYVLFETDKAVKALLQSCTHDFSNGGEYYFKISSRRMRCKEVQVIPWVLSDSNYVKQPSQRLDPTKTVFVGALHGMMNAEGLAQIMNDLFGNVVYAGIDTDKHKYPIGSGRVTFSSHKSFMKAVNAAFVEVKTPKFTKKVQIDPYLEDAMCTACACQAGPYFCRELSCFRYYCRNCWQYYHATDTTRHHKPLMRNQVRANAEV